MSHIIVAPGTAGGVTNPSGSSTDEAVARFDGTSGTRLQDSLVTIDDTGNVSTATAPTTADHLVNKAYVDALPVGGDVTGPAGGTDDAVARFDMATGKLLQNSTVTISDGGLVAGATVGAPSAAGDIANKDYVDTEVAAVPVGDVVGPGSSVASRLATYADATGKTLVNTSTLSSTANNLAGDAGPIIFSGPANVAPECAFAPLGGDSLTNKTYVDTEVAGVPQGDVEGPAAATDDAVARFNMATGKLLQDSGVTISDAGLMAGATVGAPSAAGDIASKDYVDTEVAAVPQGDVVGPAGATDDAVARFNMATGKLLQDSAVTIDDLGNVSTATAPTTANHLTNKNYVDTEIAAIPGGGDVTGPAGATDTAIPRFSGATGKLIANTGALIDGDDKVLAPNTFQHVRVIRSLADLDPVINAPNGNGVATEDFYPIPAGTLFIIDTPGNVPLVLDYGFFFNANSGLCGVDLSTSTVQFDESVRDITGFCSDNQNVYISDLTIIGGGGHNSSTGIVPGFAAPLGLFSCENFDSTASPPFHGRNKRFRVQNNNILWPHRLGSVQGFGTLNANSNFINGGGAGAGPYTYDGLHVTGGLSLEMLGNKMVLFAGAAIASTGALLTLDPNLTAVSGARVGFNVTLVEGNIFHPRDDERGIVFDAESTTALGNVSGNTFIRTGGSFPLVDYPKFPKTGAEEPQNYNALPVLNYVFDSNTGITDSRPHLRAVGGGVDFYATKTNTGFLQIDQTGGGGPPPEFERLRYNTAASGGVFADFGSSVHFVVRLSILWDIADPAVVAFSAGGTPTAGQRYQVAAAGSCDLTACAASWVNNFQSGVGDDGGIFVANGLTIGGIGSCSLIPIPDDHTMVTFEDPLGTIYQSAYVYRYEPTGITDGDGPLTTYVWATNFTSLGFPRPNPGPAHTSVTWRARTMDGTVIETYLGSNSHTTVWGGAPIFQYIDPNPRLLQVIGDFIYVHDNDKEEVSLTMGDHDDPNWADTNSQDTGAASWRRGVVSLTEHDLNQRQFTTGKNDSVLSVSIVNTKRFARADTISIYAAAVKGKIDVNRFTFTAE